MSEETKHILLGEISGVSGVKGWVKVFSHTSPRVKITDYKTWQIKASGKSSQTDKEDWRTVTVLQGRAQGKNIVAQIEGVTDRDQAAALIGSSIAIKSDQLEDLPKGEYYWKDLLGLTVKTIKDEELGVIDWLFDTGSNAVIVINGDGVISEETGKHEPERMIPFVMDEVVVSVDLEKRLMIVDWDYDF